MELACFAHSILQMTPPEVGIEDGLRALELAFQISERIQENLDNIT
jgi:hypothetical protein